jgi:hypothetical protein
LHTNCIIVTEGKIGGYKWWEEEKEDVSSYWMTLRKREDKGNWKWKHYIALCWEFVLEKHNGPVVKTDFRMNDSSRRHYYVHSTSHTTCCQLSCVLISLHNVLQAWAEVYDSPQAWHALHLRECVRHRVNFLVPQPVQTLQQYPQAITFQKLQQPFPGKESIRGKGNSLHNLIPWCDAIQRLHTFFTCSLHDEMTVQMLISSKNHWAASHQSKHN